MIRIFYITYVFLLASVPALTFAAEGIQGIIQDVGSLVRLLEPIAGALAFLFFLWGMSKFILHAGDESARAEGKEIMKWGIVALFVIGSISGIIRFVGSEFNISSGTGTLFRLP